MASTVTAGSGGRLHGGRRWWALGALLLVVLAVACIRRVSTESTPTLVAHRTLAAYVHLPGKVPALAWPREGQAAVEVEGVGAVLRSGGSTPVPIASVAKIMTAYLTLSAHPLVAGDEGFTITLTAADVEEEQRRAALGESTLRVRAGERITELQALQALLLPSANNIAALLARYQGGTLAAFVLRMNATARKLGMRHTTYTDPSGFDDETVSTAEDQLTLARAAMRIPTFAAIVDESSAELPEVGRVANYNGLVGSDGYVGVKTGSDRAAGGCLVFAKQLTIAGRRLTVLGVVLGQREGEWIESALRSGERLGDSAAVSLEEETVLPTGTTVLAAASVDGRRVEGITTSPLREIGWGGARFRVRVALDPAAGHLHRGQTMGTVSVDGVSPARTTAVAARSAGAPSLGWRLGHLL